MLPLGLVVPALLLFALALLVALRELRHAAQKTRTVGAGPVVTLVGEVLLLLGTLAVFAQGWVAGLVLAQPAGFVLFVGGSILFFVGMSLESLRAARH